MKSSKQDLLSWSWSDDHFSLIADHKHWGIGGDQDTVELKFDSDGLMAAKTATEMDRYRWNSL